MVKSLIRIAVFVAMSSICMMGIVGCQSGFPPGRRAVKDAAPRHSTEYGRRDFKQLGEIIPGFAGYFYLRDTPILIVALTDLSMADSATRVAIREFSVRNRIGFYGPAQIAVRRVKYSYSQLAEWCSRVESATAKWDLLSLGVNESTNRIRVSFRDTPSAPEIKLAMRNAGIPDDAYEFQVGGQLIIDTGESTALKR